MDDRGRTASGVTRRWLLAGAALVTTPTCIAATRGSLFPSLLGGGDDEAEPPAQRLALDAAGSTDTSRLATRTPLRLGQPVDTVLTNVAPGMRIGGVAPGLTIDGATGAIRGTPTARAWLVHATGGDGTRDSLMTATDGRPRTMKLGMNMAGIAFYSQNNVFLDHMKCSEVSIPAATSDANGMPLTLKPDAYGTTQCAWIVPMPDGRTTPVKFRIITDGDFDSHVQNIGVGGQQRTKREGRDYVFTHADGPTSPDKNYLNLRITRIRRAPTRLAVVRDDEAALFLAGKKIRPGCAAALKGFGWLRTMAWSLANAENPQTVPDDYITFKEGVGVPFRYQVAICKELGLGGWFNVHIKASDADFQAMWPALDELRAAGLDVYLELSNEVWNGQFKQWKYANDRGMERGFGSENTWMAGVKWCGFRTAQLARLSRGRGYKWIVGCQPSDQGYQEHFVTEGIAAAEGARESDIWGWSATGYASGTLTNAPANLDPAQDRLQQQWVSKLNFDAAFENLLNAPPGLSPKGTSYSVERNNEFLGVSKKIADRHNWKLVLYESNALHLNRLPDLDSRPAYERLFYGMAEHPLVKVATTVNLEASQQIGIHGATWFDFDSVPANSNFGVFGVYGRPSFDALREWVDAAPTA